MIELSQYLIHYCYPIFFVLSIKSLSQLCSKQQYQSGEAMATQKQEKPPEILQKPCTEKIVYPYGILNLVNYEFTIENFIKDEMQSIFLKNKKINSQTKAEIERRVAFFKQIFSMSSCSIVYSIIRDKIREISWKLRDFIDISYKALLNQSSMLCRLSDANGSLNKNWQKFKKISDPESLKNVYPPVAKIFIVFYQFLCDGVKQVFNLWKIIYEATEIKDLKCASIKKSLSDLILDIFVTSTKTFQPKFMLPVISLANKCKFIYSDAEGIYKRLDYTRFQEDEMAKILIERGSKYKSSTAGINPQQFNDLERNSIPEKKNPPTLKRHESHVYHKSSGGFDLKFIEELRVHYEGYQNENKDNQAELGKSDNNIITKSKTTNVDLKKIELISTFEESVSREYQIEDTSSQQDETNNFQNFDNYKDQLIQYNEEVQIEQLPNGEKIYEGRQQEGSTNLSASTGNEENNDNNDFIALKNYEEEIPSEFILPDEQLNDDDSQQIPQKGHFRLQLTNKYRKKLQSKHILQDLRYQIDQEDFNLSSELSKKMQRLTHQREKIIHNQNPKFSNKKILQQQKEKLEKYRKQLQKQKEELLRQVQRFMKEKQKDEGVYKMMTDKFTHKHHRHQKPYCSCINNNNKHFSFNRFRPSIAQQKQKLFFNISKMDLPESNQKKQHIKDKDDLHNIVHELYETIIKQGDEHQAKYIHKDSEESQKMSKRQQKLRKKMERQIAEMKLNSKIRILDENPKSNVIIDEDEANLNNLFHSLTKDDGNRAQCRIDQKQLQKWKMKIIAIKSNNVQFTPITEQTSKPKQNENSKSPKKKKKNRKNP